MAKGEVSRAEGSGLADGEYVALDARLNKAAQDDRPRQKLTKFEGAGEYGFPSGPSRYFLTGEEKVSVIRRRR